MAKFRRGHSVASHLSHHFFASHLSHHFFVSQFSHYTYSHQRFRNSPCKSIFISYSVLQLAKSMVAVTAFELNTSELCIHPISQFLSLLSWSRNWHPNSIKPPIHNSSFELETTLSYNYGAPTTRYPAGHRNCLYSPTWGENLLASSTKHGNEW